MMRRCIVLAAAFVAAFTIPAETVKTASQPWVTNYVAQAVAPLASTNQVAQKADATKIVTALCQTTTNTVVYSSTPLLIRAQVDADGVRRYRLIDLNP